MRLDPHVTGRNNQFCRLAVGVTCSHLCKIAFTINLPMGSILIPLVRPTSRMVEYVECERKHEERFTIEH